MGSYKIAGLIIRCFKGDVASFFNFNEVIYRTITLLLSTISLESFSKLIKYMPVSKELGIVKAAVELRLAFKAVSKTFFR